MHSREFTFNHTAGIRISRNLRECDVSGLDGVTRRDMGTGYVWYSIPCSESDPTNILFSLCFHSGILDSISLAVCDAALGSSWNDWSEDKERMRAKLTEDWLAANGYTTGSYPWGEIWAGYDPKGASGGGGIKYNSEQIAAADRH